MSKTLITSLGKGVYETDGYRLTTYRFNNGKEFETSLILTAILDNDPDITDVFIVGTTTSGWDMLMANNLDDNWVKVKEECESDSGLQPESHELIINALRARYESVKFTIKPHTPVIGRDTIESVFNTYLDTAREVKKDTQLMLDITHGFRSMPLLIWQALQLLSESFAEVSILYGEHSPVDKISYIRDLSAYWSLSEIIKAQYSFINNLDGFALSKHIETCWGQGAKAIQSFSEIVAANFALQVPGVLKQINNALNELPDDAPRWVCEVAKFLTDIYERLSGKETRHEQIFEYALLLAERKLYTQAVIAQQIAVEVFIAGDDGGDYEWWLDCGRELYNKKKKNMPSKYKEALSRLEGLRNQIAHGGAKSKRGGGGMPAAVNIEPTLKRTTPAVLELFKY